jgi:hypothetical protein
MHNMALQLLQPTALLQPITLLRRIRLLKGTAAEPTVELTVHLPVKPTALTSTPQALVRRPMPLLLKLIALKRRARGSGTPVPGQRNGAVCASLTSTSIAATDTRRRARLRSADPTRVRHQQREPRSLGPGLPCGCSPLLLFCVGGVSVPGGATCRDNLKQAKTFRAIR